MSLYNMMHGVNPITFFIIPMLGDKHPEEYPRFRDVFLKDSSHPEYDMFIHVYTRVGGANRDYDYGQDELMKHPNFVATFDDQEDPTYGTYVFSVPDKWKADFDLMCDSADDFNPNLISQELKDQIDKVFPKLRGKLLWHEDEPNT